jgi:phosphatidylglycerophosphate synthase
MGIATTLSKLRNKAEFNRRTSFFTDIVFFDFFAIPLTRILARIPGLTPNMITILSGLLGVAAAYFFFRTEILWGAFMMFFSLVLDCVDGDLARLTGQTSPIGAKLDRITDSIKKVLCLLALTYISSWHPALLLGLIAVHYALFRIFPARYPQGYKEARLTPLGLEPLFAPYDLLVLLLFVGPLAQFEYALIAIIFLQIVTAIYARSITFSGPPEGTTELS